jgi:hypothetical protein
VDERGYVDKSGLDKPGHCGDNPSTMTAPLGIAELAGAAGYLCCAHGELAAGGYGEWAAELRSLIDDIESEIARLEEAAHEGIPSSG